VKERLRRLKPWVFWPLILGGLGWVVYGGLGFRRVDPQLAPPPRYTTEPLGRLLRAHLRSEGMDYEGLRRDEARLRRQAAAFQAFGPQSTPEVFPNAASRLAYEINAYNTFVLLGVVTHMPIGSVRDVHGPIEPRAGFGFFYGLRFGLDGGWTNLYDLEVHLRELGDARIHAAINCASVSCPSLWPEPFDTDRLDAQLESATRRMVADPRHVRIDVDREALVLSAIFDWYDADFRAHAARHGLGSTTLDFVAHYLDGERRARFETARSAGWPVRFAPYDWSLNRSSD